MVVILITIILIGISIPIISRIRAQGQASACKSNLKTIASALEMKSIDYGGKYPANLSSLSPLYLKIIPTCPSAGADTYTNGYTSASNPNTYTIWCNGNYHSSLGYAANMPQYISGEGLIEEAANITASIPTPTPTTTAPGKGKKP
ncbi:MAG: hypothetical protein HYU63_08055 [Armatimonadetes bacterium]|nr:hypothetical protein [Armatimonadota bacterium]